MNILMISTDKKIFDENSAVWQRMFDYGTLVNKLYIVVLNRKTKENFSKKRVKIAENVYAYPTNSPNKFTCVFDALKIAFQFKNINLVTAQDPCETGFIAWRVAKKLKARLELQIHTDIFNSHFAKLSMSNKIRCALAKFLLPKADNIRVVSKRVKSSLPRKIISQKRIVVLPIFTDIAKIQKIKPSFDLHQKYPQFKFIVLMMSRLEKEKNISMAISALEKIMKVFPKTGLIIVGNGTKHDTLRRQARRTGFEQNIIFKKWTDDPISYYKTADLFLLTSNYEGYGLSLIEAIASHCSILATKVGVVGEILSSNSALLCDVGDKKCIEENLIKAQQYPSLLSQFKLKAYADLLTKTLRTRKEYLNALQNSWFDTTNKNSENI